ncbi:hypothetical protein COV19_05445 [Candidatus Woesearchaeota archaeon CG10_big_fil_rev_8_21_14_0_10_44_13]|nr:MAG: hypothetical protein COV19_05445 [Candidatus Woesearchaeota archaeon CG10_big_fil_rev_8_21_14_0_10_44_13]
MRKDKDYFLERAYPNMEDRTTFLEHIVRYRFALDFVKGKVVLDDACGTGYGTAILSKKAKKAIGIDASDKAIKLSKKGFHGNNLGFEQMDSTKLRFKDNSFDVVCSFETIEHIKNQELFLKEAARVLKKDGILIISTPNKEFFKKINSKPNPFHKKELSFDEFDGLLAKFFVNMGFFGQKNLKMSGSLRHEKLIKLVSVLDIFGLRMIFRKSVRDEVRKKATCVIGGSVPEEITLKDIKITKNLDDAQYFIAVCIK